MSVRAANALTAVLLTGGQQWLASALVLSKDDGAPAPEVLETSQPEEAVGVGEPVRPGEFDAVTMAKFALDSGLTWPQDVITSTERVQGLTRFNLATEVGQHDAAMWRVGLLMNHSLQWGKDKCVCQRWQPMYDLQIATCGTGLEFVGLDGPRYQSPFHWITSEYLKSSHPGFSMASERKSACEELRKLDSNWCLRSGRSKDKEQWYGQPWCYVSATCEAPNAYSIPNNTLAKVKTCTRPDDVIFGDLVPDMAMTYGSSRNITSPQFLSDYVYATETSFGLYDLPTHRSNIQQLRVANDVVALRGHNATYLVKGNLSWYVPQVNWSYFSGTHQWEVIHE